MYGALVGLKLFNCELEVISSFSFARYDNLCISNTFCGLSSLSGFIIQIIKSRVDEDMLLGNEKALEPSLYSLLDDGGILSVNKLYMVAPNA